MRAAGRLERRQNTPHCALCGSCSTAVAAIVAAAAVSESVELQSCSAVSGGWQTGWRAGPHLLAGQEAQGSFLALAGLLSLGWVSSCCKGVGHCVLVHCGSGRRRGASCRGKGGAAQLEGRHGDAGQLRGLAALGRCGQLGGLGVAKGCGSTACGQGGGRQAGHASNSATARLGNSLPKHVSMLRSTAAATACTRLVDAAAMQAAAADSGASSRGAPAARDAPLVREAPAMSRRAARPGSAVMRICCSQPSLTSTSTRSSSLQGQGQAGAAGGDRVRAGSCGQTEQRWCREREGSLTRCWRLPTVPRPHT